MAKLTAWLVTIIGLILVLMAAGLSFGAFLNVWLVPVLVLIIGIAKLMRNYKK